jgi:hypothetical protein
VSLLYSLREHDILVAVGSDRTDSVLKIWDLSQRVGDSEGFTPICAGRHVFDGLGIQREVVTCLVNPLNPNP